MVDCIASIVSLATPPIKGLLLISKAINLGGLFPSTRLGISTLINLFSFTSFKVCSEGVADPKIIGISASCALFILKSLAENLNPSDCLNDWSCSSSIIIKPMLSKGTKAEDRVPTIIFIEPNLAFSQVFNLLAAVCLE